MISMQNKHSNIFNSTLFLAVSSLISQLLGFIRDKLLSHIYGAGFFLDSYYAAFRVPEFMYLSIGSFVSSAILVPLFSKKLYDEDRVIWFQKLLTTFAIFFIFVYGAVMIFLPYIIKNLYGHTDLAFQHSIVIYGSILLISTFFLSLSSIISSVSQQKRKFFAVGVAPILYNLGAVLGILFLRPFWGIGGVCVGIVLGSIMHLSVSMPVALKEGLFVGYLSFINKAFSFSLLKQTLRKSFLRTLSLIASAVTFFLLTYFASLYPVGSITIISLAFTLQTVFHTLIGVSYATTIFPQLADAYVKGDHILFDSIFSRGFKKIFLISIVLTALVVLFRYEIVYILFGSGKFTNHDVLLTAGALGIFTISLYAQNIILLISRASYAKGDYILPLVTNALSAFLMYVFSFFAFNHLKGSFYTALSIPLSYSLAQYISLGVCLIIYHKNKVIKKPYLGFLYIFKIIVTIGIVAICSRYILYVMLLGHRGIIIHLIFSFIIFGFFLLCSYVILGMVHDKHIAEDRLYLKNTIKKAILALLPKFR
jgi:putative peptidoglycan lipid II flippase